MVTFNTRSKYGNRRTTIDGITFDSAAEAARYVDLKLMERCGLIAGLRLQPRYVLLDAFTDASGVKHRAVTYVADFEYQEDGQTVVEDTKGVRTAVFDLKAKLFLARYRDRVLRVEAAR